MKAHFNRFEVKMCTLTSRDLDAWIKLKYAFIEKKKNRKPLFIYLFSWQGLSKSACVRARLHILNGVSLFSARFRREKKKVVPAGLCWGNITV